MLERAVPPLEAARAVRSAVLAHAEAAEAGRTLPTELVDRLLQAGLFHLCVPSWLGGLEAQPRQLVEAIEEVSRADGSAGWCVMVGASSGLLAAYLDPAVAAEVYRPGVIAGGVYAPMGSAQAVPGGHRVSGRWSFASGCRHCAWLVGGCVVPEGPPRLMLLPRADVTIVDAWSAMGLCGTGSDDIEVAGAFVPAGRDVSLVTDRPRADGPLYRFPVFGVLALGVAAVALGIARGAIEDLCELALAKTPAGSRRTLVERPLTQAQVAQGEMELRAARALLLGEVAACWEAVERYREVGLRQRALLRAAATHAVIASARVVDAMFSLGGGTSLYRANPLERRFRDIHAVTQHMLVSPATWEVTGRVLLGLSPDVVEL
jgi:alkylation response protein AidB-like acyl-CoA dehydrogenase